MQDLLLASWALKARSNYNSYIKKWVEYCNKIGISEPYKVSYDQAMPFLSNVFYENKGSTVQLLLYVLRCLQSFQKLMDKHLGRVGVLAE